MIAGRLGQVNGDVARGECLHLNWTMTSGIGLIVFETSIRVGQHGVLSAESASSNQRRSAFGQTTQDIKRNGSKSGASEVCSADCLVSMSISKTKRRQIFETNFIVETTSID